MRARAWCVRMRVCACACDVLYLPENERNTAWHCFEYCTLSRIPAMMMSDVGQGDEEEEEVRRCPS